MTWKTPDLSKASDQDQIGSTPVQNNVRQKHKERKIRMKHIKSLIAIALWWQDYSFFSLLPLFPTFSDYIMVLSERTNIKKNQGT